MMRDHEQWRLHKAGVFAVCSLAFGDAMYAVTVTHDGRAVTNESYVNYVTASHRVNELHSRYLSDGWSGVFPRPS